MDSIRIPELRGASLAIQTDQRREIILSGPARSSKTFGILWKFHYAAMKNPGCRFLFLRKTRESMAESVLATFEHDVVGDQHFIVQGGARRSGRHSYQYDNGSEIVLAGFRQSGKDQTEKIMSTEWDGIFVNEVPELTQEEWEKLTSRLSRFTLGYSQIIGDMNPPVNSHWTWGRQRAGKTVVLKSELTDNPRWFAHGEWTPAGKAVFATLSALSGALRDRLFLGIPSAYEGIVYDNFSLDNITDEEPDLEHSYELACDDGYVDPRAILWVQRKPDHILVFDEQYHRKHLEEVCIREMLEVCGTRYGWKYLDAEGQEAVPPPDWDEAKAAGWSRSTRLPDIAIVSHEAPGLHKRFRQADIPARVGVHKIINGISVVRQLICDGNGHRSLLIHRRCKNLLDEITSGYIYPPEAAHRNEEEPLDENNHACDALRTWVWVRARY